MTRDGIERRYLLIEEQSGEPIRQHLYQKTDNPVWEPLFLNTGWAAFDPLGPLLIQTTFQESFYRLSVDRLSDPDPWRGLIFVSDAGFDDVSDWLRCRLTVDLGQDRAGLLRFYDPLIWHRLSPWSAQTSTPMARCESWDTEQGWSSVERPEFVIMQPRPKLTKTQVEALSL